MCSLLQIAADDHHADARFSIWAKRFVCEVKMPELGIVELVDVCLILQGDVSEGIQELLMNEELKEGLLIRK